MQTADVCIRITKEQIKLIHTLKSRLRMSDDEYRDKVQEIHGWSRSSKDFDFEQAADLLSSLADMAVAKGVWERYSARGKDIGLIRPIVKKKYEELGERKGMATPKQLRMIEAMWKDVSYLVRQSDRAAALRKFLKRIVGVEDMRFVEAWQAHKVVEALKKMKEAKG